MLNNDLGLDIKQQLQTKNKREFYTHNGVTYDITHGDSETVRHGGPFDRGSADSYYRRGCNPHYYMGASMQSIEVGIAKMTKAEIAQYEAGYAFNEELGDFKEW